MSDIKLPTRSKSGTSREPVPAVSVSSCARTSAADTFDFRSERFAADAQTLARTTGCALVDCRQELFMAEGDMTLAYELLTDGYDVETVAALLH